MESSTVQLLIQTAAPTLMALAAFVTSLKGLRQGKDNGVKADTAERAATEAKQVAEEAGLKTDKLVQKAELIHEVAEETRSMANGNLAGVTSELKALHLKYDELQKMVGGADHIMEELARVAANVHRIANAVTPLLNQELLLVPRAKPGTKT